MTALRTQIVDLLAVRERGDRAEKEALARRIFAVWKPVFSHLDDKDYTFHLHKHVEDASAVQIRAAFGLDASGRDRALVIARVHEHVVEGRTFARYTINAGHDPAYVQSRFGHPLILLEAWRYRLRHPRRPFFVVDCASSPASYGVYAKYFAGLTPRPGHPIPPELVALAEGGAEALGGQRVAGARMEVRRFGQRVRDTTPRRAPSARARAHAAFFHDLTGGDPELGVLVLAPLSFAGWARTTLGWAASIGGARKGGERT
jgi:hypothetical protein